MISIKRESKNRLSVVFILLFSCLFTTGSLRSEAAAIEEELQAAIAKRMDIDRQRALLKEKTESLQNLKIEREKTAARVKNDELKYKGGHKKSNEMFRRFYAEKDPEKRKDLQHEIRIFVDGLLQYDKDVENLNKIDGQITQLQSEVNLISADPQKKIAELDAAYQQVDIEVKELELEKAKFTAGQTVSIKDDYEIISISADTYPVIYENTEVQRLKNVDAARVVIKIRGEEHRVEKYEATMLLMEKGYFRQVPGAGIISTSKYRDLMTPQPEVQEKHQEEASRPARDCSGLKRSYQECQAKHGKQYNFTSKQLSDIAKKSIAWYQDIQRCYQVRDEYNSCTGQ